MIVSKKDLILEEEYLIVRNSGEIPEIALHATLYYLTEDKDGPRLILTDEDLEFLQDAALERYMEIVLRDLDPENRDLSLYRGVRRTIYNWQRMQDFCGRTGRDCPEFAAVVRKALIDFLHRESRDVQVSLRRSSINCSSSDLEEFRRQLEIAEDSLPDNWQSLCR